MNHTGVLSLGAGEWMAAICTTCLHTSWLQREWQRQRDKMWWHSITLGTLEVPASVSNIKILEWTVM